MSIGSLGYIGLGVKDPAAFDAYAREVLGLMPGEAPGRYRLDDLSWRIAVEAADADDLVFAGFEVGGPAELADLRRRLDAAGILATDGAPELCAQRQVLGMLCCQDPDGLPVEIFYGPTLRTEAPFASPAGVEGFVTGDQGLGHIVLATRDMGAARAFYQDLLGFRLSDVIHMQPSPQFGFEMEFFHCNPRHHTLALIPVPMPKRLHHFMLQVRSLDAVGFALERANAAGVPITASLGRHTNDQMVSFYSRTPAGFEVEFGQGAIEVDDSAWRVARHDRASSWGHTRPAH